MQQAVDEGSLTGADLNSDIFVKCIVFALIGALARAAYQGKCIEI